MSAATESEEETEYQNLITSLGEKLPVPQGWKILVAVPKADEKTEGGIIKPQEAMHVEEIGTIIGLVIRLGELAYRDEKKFPSGPWCREGDYIVMRSYSGTRFKLFEGNYSHGQKVYSEFRLINDDTVEAVVEDPRMLEKVI